MTRYCKRCSREIAHRRAWYCAECRAIVRVRKQRSGPPAAEAGYGAEHQRLRRQWKKVVERGGVLCARCGDLIDPAEPWDLGHHDQDRSVYTGPEHRACNRRTMTHRKQRRVTRASRVW